MLLTNRVSPNKYIPPVRFLVVKNHEHLLLIIHSVKNFTYRKVNMRFCFGDIDEWWREEGGDWSRQVVVRHSIIFAKKQNKNKNTPFSPFCRIYEIVKRRSYLLVERESKST